MNGEKILFASIIESKWKGYEWWSIHNKRIYVPRRRETWLRRECIKLAKKNPDMAFRYRLGILIVPDEYCECYKGEDYGK